MSCKPFQQMMVLPIAGEGNESFTSKEMNLFSQFLNSRLTKFLMILDMIFLPTPLPSCLCRLEDILPLQIGGQSQMLQPYLFVPNWDSIGKDVLFLMGKLIM
jgi:hypothetical protein